jgi:peptidoglycan hydrolase FlgJ
MNTISNKHNTAAMPQISAKLPLRNSLDASPMALKGRGNADLSSVISLQAKGHSKEEVHEKFTQFVGEAFYGQMFKAMRSTVGKPAYFYGGRAEEAFQGQLDQTMTEQLTKTTASRFAEPMFERQFPSLAEASGSNALGQLAELPRR